jgi:hypothetical protein
MTSPVGMDDQQYIQGLITNAALRGGTVFLEPRIFNIARPIQMLGNVSLVGSGFNPSGDHGFTGTVLQGAAGIDVIRLPSTGLASGMAIRDLAIFNGARQLVSLNLSTFVDIQRVSFIGASQYSVYCEGGIEEWRMRNCFIDGSLWGFYFNHVPVGSNDQMDKCTFDSIVVSGCVNDGWHLLPRTSNGCHWIQPVVNFNGQHGFFADGGITGWLIEAPNTESNANSAPGLYDDFHFDFQVATPLDVTFIGGTLVGTANLRYSIHYLANRLCLVGMNCAQPVKVLMGSPTTVVGGSVTLVN